MATVGDDCYFFCTSTCAKGAACPFRHVESAKTNKIICQHWQTTGCFRPMCKFRHSDFHIQVNYSEIPCYWESQPVGCSKPNCVYKHVKPRPDFSKTAAQQTKPASPEQNDGSNKNGEGKERVNEFVMPTVKPVIIDPESEASNSSPVKKPPPKETMEDDNSKQEKLVQKEPPLQKKDNVETLGKSNQKKAGKVVGKKKKPGVLTPKNGKLGAATKVVKKVKNAVSRSPQTKVSVKRKKVATIEDEEFAIPVKKKVKDRLGVTPNSHVADQKKKEKQNDDSSSSSSDSDDSIENVKVLSMEEIFRQKALESMMKKRAAEGKPMLPDYSTSHKNSTAIRSQQSKSIIVNKRQKKTGIIENRLKKQLPIKKKPISPPPPSESEEEEDEEEEEAEEEIEEQEVVDSEEESSSSESESSSVDSSESEENEVRRVVINLDAEKAAREKAKASLAKKHQVDMTASSSKAMKKRKVIQKEPTSFSRTVTNTEQRLSVKERLGKPASTIRQVARRVSPPLEEKEAVVSDEISDDNEDNEHFSDLEVKSLENIRQKEMDRLGSSPVKERLGPAKSSDEDEKSGRKILFSDDVVAPKKARKRPWSSSINGKKTRSIHQEAEGDEDQRTVSASSPVDKGPVQKSPNDEPESPFETLRRRAFLKKTQQNSLLETKGDESEEAEEVEDDVGGKRKKHKHKHKHKKHKKSKAERQIYVPPPKKSVITEVLEQVKKVPSLLWRQDDIPEYDDQIEEDDTVNKTTTTTTTLQQRPKPRAAALWAAGLSVPSKGLGGRPHLRTGAGVEKNEQDGISLSEKKPSFMTSKTSAVSLSSSSNKGGDSTVPVVKTFSQIMAEKRQKRQQAQESGGLINSSSSPSRISSKMDDSKPRQPITPIRFNLDGESKGHQPSDTKSISTSILNRGVSSRSAPTSSLFSSKMTEKKSHNSTVNHSKISSPSSAPSKSSSTLSLSDIRPTYKKARAKKFNKKAAAESSQSTLSNSDPPTHISSLPLVAEAASSSSSVGYHPHHHLKSIENPSDTSSGRDAAVSLKSPNADGRKQRSSSASESHLKQSASLDDEFSIFDGGEEIEDISDIVGKDVEPIDDLLQDIDDLLA